ncbi:MAG TPA: GntG family PLP-dependent aldolase [Phycisphaerae bacterium]|nr:GntG family PLP-dependent aldolase [Phycisphaerae bacterium]HRW54251.1 GntG family PLP-dependent aldolase [Phycisphaerae bacterium]
MTIYPVDLSSDTQTRPTPAMRQAIANAEVGDEQKREDPSVNRLQAMAAELCGKEAALFLPTGTMCNLIAHFIHCRAGDEIILDVSYHPVNFEGAGPSLHSRAAMRFTHSPTGIFSGADVDALVRPKDPHFPSSRLVCVENTVNLRGGRVWPIEAIRDVTSAARRHSLATHLDGARLMNAVVASGVSAAAYCEHFDSAWLDLSKGLGCPVGGVLVGSQAFIDQAWRWKHSFGGAMRQAGVIAAAGVYALEHNIERLAEDHDKARRLAAGLTEIRGIDVDVASVESNIVVFDIGGTGLDRATFLDRVIQHGVRFSPLMGPTELRAVTHLDIPDDGVERAMAAVKEAVA